MWLTMQRPTCAVPKPPFVRNVLGIAAGYGLLTLEGPDHQALRRFMNQAFAFKYLNDRTWGRVNMKERGRGDG